jgi:hypothetical protein
MCLIYTTRYSYKSHELHSLSSRLDSVFCSISELMCRKCHYRLIRAWNNIHCIHNLVFIQAAYTIFTILLYCILYFMFIITWSTFKMASSINDGVQKCVLYSHLVFILAACTNFTLHTQSYRRYVFHVVILLFWETWLQKVYCSLENKHFSDASFAIFHS